MAIKHIFLISNLYQFCVPYGFDPRLKSVLMPERKFQLCSILAVNFHPCQNVSVDSKQISAYILTDKKIIIVT